MSRKKQGRTSPASSKKRTQRSAKSRSPAIPIIVGLVVVAIVVGVLISLDNRRSAGGGDATGAVATARAQATQLLPFSGVARISLDEALEKLEQGEAVLVDVRSSASYDNAHAAGATSIPEEEIDARINELPRDQDLVLY